MAEENVFGGRFEIDVSSAKNALSDARRMLRVTNGEFNETTAGLDKTANATDILEAKSKKLTDQIKIQEQVVETLKKDWEKMKDEYGENSKEAQNAYLEYSKWNTQLKNNKKLLEDTTKELNELNNEQKENTKSTSEASKGTGGFAKALGGIAKGVAGAVVAIAGLATSFLGLAESTREYRTQMAKLETSFKDASFSAKDATKTYTTLYGVLADEGKATEASQQLAELATTEKDLEAWTDILTGAYAKFGDSLPVESLAEASNETAKTGKITGALADALNWAGASEEDFQKQLDGLNSESERAQLIQETLNGLYKEASDEYKTNAKDIIEANEATASWNNALAQLGAVAEPIATIIKNIGTTIVTYILPYVQKFADGLKLLFSGEIQEGLASMGGTLATIGDNLAVFLGNVINKIAEFIPVLLPKIAEILVAIINKLIEYAPILLSTAETLLYSIADAIPPTIEKILQEAPKIVDNLLSLIGEWIPRIFEIANRLWDKIVEAIPGLIQNLTQNLPKIISSILDFFINNAPSVFQGALGLLRNIVKSLPTIITELVKGIGDLVLNIGKTLIQKAPEIKKSGKEMFNSLLEAIPGIGADLIRGLWEGIKSMGSWIGQKLEGFTDGVLDDIKNFFGIHSPSTETEGMGENLDYGLIKGIKKRAGEVKKAWQQELNLGEMKASLTANSGQFASGGKVVNITQNITSPKAIDDLEVYRRSKSIALIARGV